MKISELVDRLETLKNVHGDLETAYPKEKTDHYTGIDGAYVVDTEWGPTVLVANNPILNELAKESP